MIKRFFAWLLFMAMGCMLPGGAGAIEYRSQTVRQLAASPPPPPPVPVIRVRPTSVRSIKAVGGAQRAPAQKKAPLPPTRRPIHPFPPAVAPVHSPGRMPAEQYPHRVEQVSVGAPRIREYVIHDQRRDREQNYYSLYANTGLATGKLRWTIGYPQAVPITAPNILSELTWDSLTSPILTVGGKFDCKGDACGDTVGRIEAYGSFAYDGDVQDSDFLGNNRTAEFSRSKSDASDSTTYGVLGGLGYRFHTTFGKTPISLTPLLGYAYDNQTMHMTDGVQTLGDGMLAPSAGTQITGLDSRYEAEWKGPFVELETRITLARQHQLRLMGRYHHADYHGTGTWNLRDDFAQPNSYEHFADGSGRVFALGYSYRMTPQWELAFDVMQELWKADNGLDVTHFSDGTDGYALLNEVKWKSRRYMVGVAYAF